MKPVDLAKIEYTIITPDSSPSGNKPYKIYMGPGPWGNHFRSNMEIYNALEKYAGKSVTFHCEDPIALEQYRGKQTHEQRRPPTCEVEAVEFALNLITKFGISGRVCNVSTFDSAELIRKYTKASVMAEVMSEHLMHNLNTSSEVVFPPLRSAYDNQKLCGYLKSYRGFPDCVTHITPAFLKWAKSNLSEEVIGQVLISNPARFAGRW